MTVVNNYLINHLSFLFENFLFQIEEEEILAKKNILFDDFGIYCRIL